MCHIDDHRDRKVQTLAAPLRRLEDVSLADRAHDALREAILEMKLKPGEPLVEQKLAESLGISKTPIRQALQRLIQAGLVVNVPNRGYTVSQLRLQDAHEILVIRAELEGLAARLACLNLTDEGLASLENIIEQQEAALEQSDTERCAEIGHRFHRTLMDAAGNERLGQMIGLLNDQFHRVRLLSSRIPGRVPHSVPEHRRVLNALRDRNPDQSAYLMREHLLEVYKDLEHDRALDGAISTDPASVTDSE